MINKNALMILGTCIVTATTASLVMQQAIASKTNLASKNEQFSPMQSNKIYIIDLNETNSVEDLLKKFNSITNVFMPESILGLTEKEGFFSWRISENSFNKLKNYTKNINFQYEKIMFWFEKEAYEIDLTPIKTQVDIIRKKLDVDYSQVLSNSEALKLINQSKSKAPNMVALLSHMAGLTTAMKMAPMTSIPDKGYLTYLEMMKAYHSFAWKISQSKAYKNWTSSKNISYKLIKKEFLKSPKIEYVAHNKGYDAKPKNISSPSPLNPLEINNLEAQLVLSLTNLYGIAS